MGQKYVIFLYQTIKDCSWVWADIYNNGSGVMFTLHAAGLCFYLLTVFVLVRIDMLSLFRRVFFCVFFFEYACKVAFVYGLHDRPKVGDEQCTQQCIYQHSEYDGCS